METHIALTSLLAPSPHKVEVDSDSGRAMRHAIHEHYQTHDDENRDLGIEMDHRHKSCVYVIPKNHGAEEPPWTPRHYIPSTWPGHRAPQVFLRDGSSIFDHYGKYFTVIEFVDSDAMEDRGIDLLLLAAQERHVPMKHVSLIDEDHARRIWEQSLVIVRPDGHVAWRGCEFGSGKTAREVVEVVAGFRDSLRMANQTVDGDRISEPRPEIFAATTDMVSQTEDYQLDKMGIMQS